MVLFFPGGMGWSNSLGQTWKTTNSCFKAYSRLDLWYSCAWKTCFLGLRFWLVLSDGYHWVFCPEKSEKWDDHPDAQHWLLNTDSRSEHPGVGPSLFNADEVMLFLHFTMWTRFFIPQLSAGCGCLVKSFSVWKLSFQLCLDGFVHGFVQFCHQSLTCFVQFGASNLRKAVFGTAGSIKSWTTAGWMLLLDQTMHQNLKLKQIKQCLRLVQVPPLGIDGHWWIWDDLLWHVLKLAFWVFRDRMNYICSCVLQAFAYIQKKKRYSACLLKSWSCSPSLSNLVFADDADLWAGWGWSDGKVSWNLHTHTCTLCATFRMDFRWGGMGMLEW